MYWPRRCYCAFVTLELQVGRKPIGQNLADLNWCTNNKELSNVLELGCKIYQLYDSNKMVNQVRIHRYGDNLDLEASAVPPSSCLLKLPSLGAHIRLCVAVRHTRRRAKVLHSFPSILRSPQQNLRNVINCEIQMLHTLMGQQNAIW